MKLYKSIALIGIGYILRDQQNRPKCQDYRAYSNYQSPSSSSGSVAQHLKQILNDKLDLLFYGNCTWRPVMTRYAHDHSTPSRYYPVRAPRAVVEEVQFDSMEQADQVLEEMRMLLERYGRITLSDYYEIANEKLGRPIRHEYSVTDTLYHWKNLNDVEINKVFGGGWKINLPEPQPQL